MKHEVGRSVNLEAPAATVTEYSRAVAMGSDNSAMFEVWYRSRTPTTAATLTVSLEGTNDLAQWSPLSSMSESLTDEASYKSKTSASVIPWKFVRLKYSLSSLSTSTVSFSTAITTFEEA
jgi:hypothetical protein